MQPYGESELVMVAEKKRWARIIPATGIIILLLSLALCYYTGVAVFKGSMQLSTNEKTGREQMESYLQQKGFSLPSFMEAYMIETVSIPSILDGHPIPADFISADGNWDADTVIMVHGLGGSRISVYPWAALFLRNGYNVLAYDQRSAGENMAPYTTFGYLESYDLRDYVDFVKTKLSAGKKIGAWGVSYGGATVGIYLGSRHANQNLNFAILDSPISSMRFMMAGEMVAMDLGIPVGFLMAMGNMVTRWKLGFSYDDADVGEHMRRTQVPVLVINSRADEVTPYFMGLNLYEAVPHGKKGIYTVEDSAHADIVFDYPENYEAEVLGFIKKVQ